MRQVNISVSGGPSSWVVDRDCTLLQASATVAGLISKGAEVTYTKYASPSAASTDDKFAVVVNPGVPVNLYLLPFPVQLLRGEPVFFSTSGVAAGSAMILIDP